MNKVSRVKVILLAWLILILASCANVGSNSSKPQEQTLEEFINNKGSMTVALKKLSPNFSVELLKNGVIANNYVRISSLKLDNTPVLAAYVSTNVSNQTFVQILRNASTTPIGKMLFAPGADIHRRDDMKITVMTVHEVNSAILHDYLHKIGYDDSTHIVARYSEFYHKDETLSITEYILPSMTKYFKR